MYFPPIIGRSVLVVTAERDATAVNIIPGVIEGYLVRTTAQGEDERVLVRTRAGTLVDVPPDCVLGDSWEVRGHVDHLLGLEKAEEPRPVPSTPAPSSPVIDENWPF